MWTPHGGLSPHAKSRRALALTRTIRYEDTDTGALSGRPYTRGCSLLVAQVHVECFWYFLVSCIHKFVLSRFPPRNTDNTTGAAKTKCVYGFAPSRIPEVPDFCAASARTPSAEDAASSPRPVASHSTQPSCARLCGVHSQCTCRGACLGLFRVLFWGSFRS